MKEYTYKPSLKINLLASPKNSSVYDFDVSFGESPQPLNRPFKSSCRTQAIHTAVDQAIVYGCYIRLLGSHGSIRINKVC